MKTSKNYILFLILILSVVSCKRNLKDNSIINEKEFEEIINKDYELFKPKNKIKSVLILFGGYTDIAKDTKKEFDIFELSKANDLAVIYSNINQKLWLNENEKNQITIKLKNIFHENQLPYDNVFIGGFSSGGTVSFLISDYLVGNRKYGFDIKGVFIVDSPIDLNGVYSLCQNNIERDFSKPAIRESEWLMDKLSNSLGNPKDNLDKYEENSVFTLKTRNTDNISNLKDIKIRLYTDPDTIWWKTNRKIDYEELNAFYIKKLSENLKEKGFNNVEYIASDKKGYKLNGERHPHSWSIVDKNELMTWISN